MPFTLAVVALAVGLSYLRGGRLHRLADAPLHWSWLLLAGVALQAAVDLGAARGLLGEGSRAGWLLLLASQLLVVGWVLRNRHLPGTLLVALGLVCNATVMAANGAMPVAPEAMTAVGADPGAVPEGKHTLLTAATHLPWLADVLPVPPLRSIISVGDLLLAAGLIPIAHALLSHEPSGQPRTEPSPSPEAPED